MEAPAHPGRTAWARIAAEHGARVMVAEEFRVGGTCVIRGCVPKKLLVYGAHFAEDLQDARRFGWKVEGCAFEPNSVEEISYQLSVGRLAPRVTKSAQNGKDFPPGSLILGSPAKVIRPCGEAERAMIEELLKSLGVDLGASVACQAGEPASSGLHQRRFGAEEMLVMICSRRDVPPRLLHGAAGTRYGSAGDRT